jgi:hypothetical protein
MCRGARTGMWRRFGTGMGRGMCMCRERRPHTAVLNWKTGRALEPAICERKGALGFHRSVGEQEGFHKPRKGGTEGGRAPRC